MTRPNNQDALLAATLQELLDAYRAPNSTTAEAFALRSHMVVHADEIIAALRTPSDAVETRQTSGGPSPNYIKSLYAEIKDTSDLIIGGYLPSDAVETRAPVEEVVAWHPIGDEPAACHVIGARVDPASGEWIYAVGAAPLSQPFTHWWMLPAPPDTPPAAINAELLAERDALKAERDILAGLVRGWHYLAVGPDEMGDYYTHKQLVKASEPWASPSLSAIARAKGSADNG